ncbi:ABC transporter permease [Bacillus sp. VT 712]|uniref:PilZ domain-containing protein n=1 Tax=Bacillaceae TaxID=186817 RepID=UPI0007A4A933|nr:MULTISPECIES: PilZ domain-containing protein [Bacillaceae]AQX55504.1 ABC transporter permease [Priestia flexa]KZB90739.1 ABC transporter permease [Bacillus sp. VT 712]MCG7313096.1 PilZ domain-containing protein [Priestia flexa]MCM3067082.1 PilZ domain-containing protein [Priestia flexa]
MQYKREEPFRFTFAKPIVGTFFIKKYDGKDIESKLGPLAIIDLSPRGMKLITPLDLPVFQKPIELTVNFSLLDENLTITGLAVWKEKSNHEFLYGIEAFTDENQQQLLLDTLKQYAKEYRKR